MQSPPRRVAMVSPEILERFPTRESNMAAAWWVFWRGPVEQWLTVSTLKKGPD